MIINLLYFQLLFVDLSILHIPQVVCQSFLQPNCFHFFFFFFKLLHRVANECFCLVHYTNRLHLVRALNPTPDGKACCCNAHTTEVQRGEKRFASCVATNLILGITLQQVSFLASLTRVCVCVFLPSAGSTGT